MIKMRIFNPMYHIRYYIIITKFLFDSHKFLEELNDNNGQVAKTSFCDDPRTDLMAIWFHAKGWVQRCPEMKQEAIDDFRDDPDQTLSEFLKDAGS